MPEPLKSRIDYGKMDKKHMKHTRNLTRFRRWDTQQTSKQRRRESKQEHVSD